MSRIDFARVRSITGVAVTALCAAVCAGLACSGPGFTPEPIAETSETPKEDAPSVTIERATRNAEAAASGEAEGAGADGDAPSASAESSGAPLAAGPAEGMQGDVPAKMPESKPERPAPDPAQQLAAHLPAIAAATEALLEALDATQREEAVLPFDDEVRTDFDHTPGSRPGTQIEAFDSQQIDALNRLLGTLLSERGFQQVWGIMALEDNPNELDDLPYFLAVFGDPGSDEWGLRLEGHHLSLNFTFIGGRLSATPVFMGANPARVLSGEREGERTLGEEDDLGLQLFEALEPELQDAALLDDDPPGELLTGDVPSVEPFSNHVATVSEFNAEAQGLVRDLIWSFVGDLHPTIADAKMARLDEVGYGDFTFAWFGPTSAQQNHYFHLQGPNLLIEFLLKQRNHQHAVWREFEGDYGRALR